MGILKILSQTWRGTMKKGLLIPSVSLYVFILVLGGFTEALGVTATTSNTGIQTKQEKNVELLKKIEAFSNEQRIEPINATVDRIWKAIPGYNGLDVNITLF